MDHPFALSSFRIQSAEQIATIRNLGLAHVRWDPDASLPPEAAAVEASPATADAPPPTAAAAEADERRARLASHRLHTAQLERECGEAGRALRDATRRALSEPAAARDDTQALSRKLLDRLDANGESCIRLVNSQAGDRASAHGLNVTVMALLLGRTLGLDDEGMMALGVGALLHDLGKLELPDRLRHQEDGFNTAQTNAYREHVAHGVTIGRRMGLSTGALAVIGQHHEMVDGSGFPLRLTAERITLAARIVAIADRYDNLCNPAVRTRALTPHEAVSTLFTLHRQRHDAALLGGFIRMMGVYPAGSLVQLTDDRWAMVMAVNAARPLKPRVLVHDPKVPADEALLLDLEHAPDLGIRRSLPVDRVPADAREYLAPATTLSYFFEAAPRAEEPR
jgi:putative nucleotidyltransferase with HDIG domain